MEYNIPNIGYLGSGNIYLFFIGQYLYGNPMEIGLGKISR